MTTILIIMLALPGAAVSTAEFADKDAWLAAGALARTNLGLQGRIIVACAPKRSEP